MDNGKLFLIEKGTFVVIRNENGIEHSFETFEEFNQHNPLDLTGKNYLCYEPDRSLFIDNTIDNLNRFEGPIQEYENIIADIENIITNVENPYFNKPIGEIKIKAIELLNDKTEEYISNKWTFRQQINASLGLYNQTIIDEIKTKLLNVMGIINTAKTDINNSTDLAEIKTILENAKIAIAASVNTNGAL